MKLHKVLVLFGVMVLLTAGAVRSQSVASLLERTGLSDIRVIETPDEIRIAYENLDYHSEVRALASVLRVVAASTRSDEVDVGIFIQSQRIPVAFVGTGLGELRKRLEGALSHEEWLAQSTFEMYNREIHGEVPQQGRSWQGMDLGFGVGMRYQLGDYFDPWKFAFDLQPELRIPFGTGWYASVRGAIPMYNNLDLNDYIRPSLATVNKVFRLDEGLYGGVSAGLFGRNRVGIQGKLQAFLWDEVITVTLEGAYTDYTDLTGKVYIEYLENRRFTTYSGGIAHRWKEFDLHTSVRYGNFLYYDSGVIAETYRQFGDLVIGFFYSNTRLGDNIGFRFDIPLVPRRSVNAGPVRVGTSRHFFVTYRYTGGMLDAREFDTGLHFFEVMRQMYPSFLANELRKHLH